MSSTEPMSDEAQITQWLAGWRAGDAAAGDALMRAVYPVLRSLAQARLNRHAHQPLTLRATELANEAYMRLHQQRATDWQDRVHFFSFSAKVIRGLAVDHVRARGSEKRGGGAAHVTLEQAQGESISGQQLDVLAVDQALNALEREDVLVARIVELKFFSGLDTDEIAAACDISRATVVRHWRYARAWLADWMQQR
jgi:RNA polymerase sigma factor (TIGR02999 family)